MGVVAVGKGETKVGTEVEGARVTRTAVGSGAFTAQKKVKEVDNATPAG